MRLVTPALNRKAFIAAALAVCTAPFIGTFGLPEGAQAASAGARAKSAAGLGPLINIPQTWNNCGPATLAEVLAFWGVSRTQAEIQGALRVDGPSAGMTPYGIPSYARSAGLRALVGVGGSQGLVKRLVAAGLPVIVHQVVSLGDRVGHWRPIESYNDARGVFVASDPYLGPDHEITYGDFAQMWALRGNTFVVLYPATRGPQVQAIVRAAGWNRAAAFASDLALLRTGQLDAAPAGTPGSAAAAYRFLGLAWDAAQMGQGATARAYLRSAVKAGANQVEAGWVAATIATG